MAKINITVDIDWLDDVNFDDMLKDEILYGIRNYLKDKAVAEIQKKVDKEIAKVISDATGVIQKQVDMIKNARQAAEEEIIKSMEQALKNNLAEETVKKMNIPQVLKNLQERYVAVGEKRK